MPLPGKENSPKKCNLVKVNIVSKPGNPFKANSTAYNGKQKHVIRKLKNIQDRYLTSISAANQRIAPKIQIPSKIQQVAASVPRPTNEAGPSGFVREESGSTQRSSAQQITIPPVPTTGTSSVIKVFPTSDLNSLSGPLKVSPKKSEPIPSISNVLPPLKNDSEEICVVPELGAIQADTSSEVASNELQAFPTLSEKTKNDILVVNTYSSSMEQFKDSFLRLMHVCDENQLIDEMIHIVNHSSDFGDKI